MANMHMLWNNLHPDATVTASSADADWPVSYLKLYWPTLTHRTTGIASEWWKWDLGAATQVRYFILWNHNFTSGATLTLQANASDSWGAPAYSTAVTRYSGFVIAAINQTYRWWRLVVADAGNGDGYLKAGYAYLGGYFAPTYGYTNRTCSLVDPSIIAASADGQFSAAQHTQYKELGYEFAAVLDADRSTLETIWASIGTYKPHFIVETPSDLGRTYYVRNISPWPFEPVHSGIWAWSFQTETMR
jgi:hypothetical protein